MITKQTIVTIALLLQLILVMNEVSAATPSSFTGRKSTWNGYTRYDFEVDGKQIMVITPKVVAPGSPWVWHGEYFGQNPAPDIALLGKGFHVVYLKIPDLLGCPQAVQHWNVLYKELTSKYQLAKKVALIGLSRGGLYCYNWAAENPGKVACIFGDAPVCDLKSWPMGIGKGSGNSTNKKIMLKVYHFKDEAEAFAYKQNPIDKLEPLAKAKIPIMHIYGDADKGVPWDENTGVLAKRYRKLGGSIRLISKSGGGHHPHGLEDATPIINFIAKYGAAVKPKLSTTKRLDPVNTIAVKLEPTRLATYKTVNHRELYLHIFEPEGLKQGDQRPCFLIIHGGGWGGMKPRRMYPFAEHFAKLGLVGISIQYRLYNKKKRTTVFDCVKDSCDAVRFVRSHAKSLGIDPQKIIVSGGSAGGHLAVGTALFDHIDQATKINKVSCTPNALVLLFPVIDTSKAGYGQKKIGERWKELSPVHHVSGKLPPTIVFHGTGDTVTPFAGAKAFHEAMLQQGNHCELVINKGGRHGYLMFNKQLYLDTLKRTEKFLTSQEMMWNP